MKVLDYIRRSAERCPDRVAVMVHGDSGQTLSYAEVLAGMQAPSLWERALPLPLLGEAWDKDFTLHTTGTTGEPKAVTITQERVVRDSLNLIRAHGYEDGVQFIIAGPMDHLGCWSKIFPTLFVGGTLHILPHGMKDLEAFFEIQGRLATFLVPSAIRMLLQFASDRLASFADRIDFIETGAAPMAHSDKLRLCELLPASRLYNTYASTEAGIVATYNYNDGICKDNCCGVPFGNVPFSIGADGIIGGSSDVGFMDEDGMLHIVGRQDDMINVGGLKVSPVEVEEAAMQLPCVRDCICIPRPHPLMGSVPALLLVMADGEELDRKALVRHLADVLGKGYKMPQRLEAGESIRYTFNGKKDRKSYVS